MVCGVWIWGWRVRGDASFLIVCYEILGKFHNVVGEEGLEPSRRKPLVPKTSVSTNSTTRPCCTLKCFYFTYTFIECNMKKS